MEETIKLFNEYTSHFDMTNKRIEYKYHHTYRVVDEMKALVESMALDEDDKALAIVIAVLHDLGRFKQVELINIFNDNLIDHAILSNEVVNEYKGFLDIPIIKNNRVLIEKALLNHNKLKIDDDVSERELLFCRLIRDADKLDILYALSTGQISLKTNNQIISEKIVESILNQEIVNRLDMVTETDRIVCSISMVYDLCFKFSINKVKCQKYCDIIIDKLIINNNLETDKFYILKNKLNEYLTKKTI